MTVKLRKDGEPDQRYNNGNHLPIETRFGGIRGNKPMSAVSVRKIIAELMNATAKEIDEIIDDETRPAFIRRAAELLLRIETTTDLMKWVDSVQSKPAQIVDASLSQPTPIMQAMIDDFKLNCR